MKNNKVSHIVMLLVLAMTLTACSGTPSVGAPGTGEVNNPESSVNPGESDKPDSQLPSQSEDPSGPDSQLPNQSEDPSESEKPIDEWVSLTEDELKWFNVEFFNTDEDVRKNSFLTCVYTDASQISIYDIFYDLSEEISDEEEKALQGSAIDYETDFQKLTIPYMDGILRANMNISLEEVEQSDLSKYMYLKEYDAYYDSHGDANGSPVEVKSGMKDKIGNVKLQYLSVEDEQEYVVTLKAHEKGYYFVSNVLKNAPTDEPVEMSCTALKESELKWFNEQFFNVEGNQIVNYFLNCAFADIKDINIYYVFENEPSSADGNLSKAEESALEKTDIDMDLDIHKIPVEYINTVLKRYANLTLEETNKVGIDSLVYLKDFDAYYLSAGDVSYSSYTMTSGQRYEDGTVKLQYQHEIEFKRYEVTLQPYDNGYLFVSNLEMK